MRSGACPRHRGDSVSLLPAAPPSLGAARTLLPQHSLQANRGGQSQTHQLRRTPNIPSAPHGSNGAVSFQEALEGTDRSKRKKGQGSAGVLPSSLLASLPSLASLDRGHTLTHLGHCSCCLLPLANPKAANPCSLPPRLQEARTHWALRTLAITTSQGHQQPASICPPLCMRVTRAFCGLSPTTHTCSRGRAHTCSQGCAHTYTHAYMGTRTHTHAHTHTEALCVHAHTHTYTHTLPVYL